VNSKFLTTIMRSSCAAVVLSVAMPSTVFAETYPSRAIRLVVGFAPGTGPDILARTLGQELSTQLGQPVVVENRDGAGGRIAAQFVAKSPSDGYTVLIADVSAISIAPAAFSKLGYDPARELVPVSEVARTDFVLVVPNSSGSNSAATFVDAAKKQDKINFGTFGAGTPGHFGAEMFASQEKFRIEPIHYRATGDAVSAIISGDVNAAFVSTALASAQVKGGKLRALATTAPQRSTLLPDVPTFNEAGYPKADFSAWFSLFVPAGTAKPVISALNAAAVKSMDSAAAKRKLEEAGFSVVGSSIADTQSMVIAETERWKKVVAATGFKGD